MLNDERGSLVLGVGLVFVVLILVVAVAAVGTAVAAYIHAAGAADAAALAAAPVTFRPFGATGSPSDEAARFARSNGSRLVRCVCRVDRSWKTRTVAVTVRRSVTIPGIGSIGISASSRATFEPSALLPP